MLCGGRSAERDVSCVSAAAILRNLGPRYRPLLVRVDVAGRWWLQTDPRAFSRHPQPFLHRLDRIPAALEPGAGHLRAGSRRLRIDVVFPIIHGPMGEDGTLQGLLELAGLPYVGAGVLGSAVGMDKEVTKRLAVHAGLPLLPYEVLRGRYDLARARRLKLPVFVKPARLGSSVGVYKVKKAAELAAAVRRAFRFDTTVLVEQGIAAREIECAVLGSFEGGARSSAPGEIRPNAEFYSYEAKYLDPDGAELIVPARLSAAESRNVQELAIRAFLALGGFGMARVDFLMDKKTGKLYFNEVNTLPGFTSISMYPKLWEYSGLPFPKLVDRLIQLAFERHRAQARLCVTRD